MELPSFVVGERERKKDEKGDEETEVAH